MHKVALTRVQMPRRPGALMAALLMAGFAALSVHVGMLAAGVAFPVSRAPLWARWLSEAFVAGGLILILKLATPNFVHRSFTARTLVAFFILVAIQESFRAGIMNGVVTGGWAYSAIGMMRPLLRGLIVASACVAILPSVRGVRSLLVAILLVASISVGAGKVLAHALEPIIQHFAWLARPDLFEFPYPTHVTVAAYLTFIEAVAGAAVMTMLVWNQLPGSKLLRLLTLALLVALIKGVVGYTLFYSFFTGVSPLAGALSWSQFLFEFLTLGFLVGLAWATFGRPSNASQGKD